MAPEKDGTNGGAPGANIRNGIIYRPDRVTLESTDALRFNNTRDLLIANFDYQGNKVAVLGAHLNSKRGDTTLFGLQQPPVLGSVAWRVDLATQINKYAQTRLIENPDLNLVVAGDLNDFEFSKPLKALKGDILTNLVDNHDENDRFSYFYNGNAQTLDHMLVNNGIVDYVKFDMVHINALFMEEHGRASDHDPVIAKIYMLSLIHI